MRWPRLLAATLVVASVASCGGDGSNNGASPVPDPGPEATVLAPVATQLPQVETALSKEILADEDVTKPEIERALAVLEACLRDRGFDTSSVVFYPPWSVEVQVGSSNGSEGDASAEALNECSQGVQQIQDRYFLLHGPTPQQRDQLRSAQIACLQAAGFNVGSESSIEDMLDVVPPSAVQECEDVAKSRVG